MFVFGNLLISVAKITDILLNIYLYIIIGRAIISWVNPDPYNPIVSFLYRATEPVLSRVRNKFPYMGGIDLSPLAVMLAIYFVKMFITSSVAELGYRLKMGGL
jgi:YggT family protein